MSAYSDLMLSTAPVAYWRLGDAAGTTAVDSSGNSHNGTYVNGPILGQPGLIDDPDTAVFFDGVNDRVGVTQHADLKLPGAMTAQAWIRPTALTGTGGGNIIFQGIGFDTHYAIHVLTNGALSFNWYDGAFKVINSPAGVVTVGSIHHVAVTRDASLFVRLYVDGVEVASGQGTAPIGDPAAMYICFVNVNFKFSGTIDEVAVHNVALTPEQVADLYEMGVNPPPPPPSAYRDAILSTSPVAYWRLGESAGVTAVDATGNGHNGTYTNGPLLGQPGLIADTDTAVFFDGSNDRVDVPQDPALQITGALTVQAWIMHASATGGRIVYEGDDNDVPRLYDLYVRADGRLGVSWHDGAFKTVEAPAGTIVPGNTYHVAATRDASLFIRIYANGLEVASGQGTTPGTSPAPTFFSIGRLGNFSNYFDGLIDEVAVHNYALTGPQVAELYDLGVNGPPPPPPPPPPSGGGVTRPARRYHRMGRGVTR